MKSYFITDRLSIVHWLAIIVTVGLFLRAATIFWGTPVFDPLEGQYHPDEGKISSPAVTFPDFIFQSRDLRYPTLFHIATSLLLLPVRAVDHLLGLSSGDVALLSKLIARSLSVVAGTATILLTFLLGRRLGGAGTGLAAAALCCFSLYHVLNSAVSTTDVPSSFFLAVFLLFALRLYEPQPSLAHYVLTGVALGLLMGMKYTGAIAGVILLFPLITQFSTSLRNNGQDRIVALRTTVTHFLVLGIVAGAVLLLTTPGIVLHPDAFVVSLLSERERMAGFRLGVRPADVLYGIIGDFFAAFGPPMALTFFACCGYLLMRHVWRRKDLFTIAAIAMTIALIAIFNAALLPRYLILIVPVVCVIIPVALNRFAAAGRPWRRPAATLALTVTLAFSAAYTLVGVYLRGDDTRTAAAHYIHRNIEPGTEIGISYVSEAIPWSVHPWRYPRIHFQGRYRYTDILQSPSVIVTSSYDIRKIERALISPHLSEELVWNPAFNGQWYRGRPPSPRLLRFYKRLLGADSPYQLIAEFEKPAPIPIELPSPTIRVYVWRDQ